MANMYGYNTSSAHKYEYTDMPGRGIGRDSEIRERRQTIENAKRKAENVKRQRKVNRASSIIKIAVIFAVAFTIISRYVAINEANSKVAELKAEYNSIVAANQDLQAKIDKTVDLKKLQSVASEKLGMMRPERYQIFYVDMERGDYSENVEKEKEHTEKENVAVMGVHGTIISAMEIFE